MKKISVLGAGSWGTTLALLLVRNGFTVTLWEFFEDYAQEMQKSGENTRFLPGALFPNNLNITADLKKALNNANILVLAVPSHVLRSLLGKIQPLLSGAPIFVSVIKGIEQNTLMCVNEVVEDTLGQQAFVALSGPTHAEEVAKHIPSAIVAASTDISLAKTIQEVFTNVTFKVYTNPDLIGVEVGGSLKNVIALAAGISDGMGFGDNSKSAVMTRGLSEITRLGVAMGAQAQTFSGLSGIGDLITTCISKHSRNRYVGERLGQGESLSEIIDSMQMVAEGVNTTYSTYALAHKLKIEMPIIEEMHKVLVDGKSPHKAVKDLLQRPLKTE
jgi:glycerol-3-phosphate dehydrogenase (NAD(P)+)